MITKNGYHTSMRLSVYCNTTESHYFQITFGTPDHMHFYWFYSLF